MARSHPRELLRSRRPRSLTSAALAVVLISSPLARATGASLAEVAVTERWSAERWSPAWARESISRPSPLAPALPPAPRLLRGAQPRPAAERPRAALTRPSAARATAAHPAPLRPASPRSTARREPTPAEAARAIGLAEIGLAPSRRLGDAAILPRPLPPSEAARWQRVFENQSRGDFASADRELERLEDRRLIGHVLAERWLRPGTPPPAEAALRGWLDAHADHPDAPRLHALLLARAPTRPVPPLPEETGPGPDEPLVEVPPEERAPAARPVARNPSLDRTVREMAERGDVQAALRHVAVTRGMTPAYASLLQTDVAFTLFAQGRDAEALRAATLAARQPGAGPRAAYVAGLAAFANGRYEQALGHFETAARSDEAPAAARAAAAFWTARTAVRARRPQAYVPWMLQAAQEPRTFYGLIARRALGLPAGFAWESDVAGEAEMASLAETAGGWRALALMQVGQRARAEAELRRLLEAARGNASLNRAMLAVASQAGMTDLAAALASAAQSADGRPRDYARFPVPPLSPQGGWRADPALVYALVRQESNFDADAVSPAGARGLMQVMPATAAFVAGDPALLAGGLRRLHDPRYSLELGQRYLHHLAGLEIAGGDLIRVLAAYNAGPGNLARWLPALGKRDDPFLFVEGIPFDETRAYVPRVLAYSWIYASRLGLPSPSLDALAAGERPRFMGVEELARVVARNRTASPR